MALVERIMHWETEPANRWISVHEFFAALSELAGGALTVAQIKSYYQMTPEDEVDFDALVALSPKSTEGRMMLVDRVHSIFLLGETGAPGYSSPTDVRGKITGVVFPKIIPHNYTISVANLAWTNMPAAVTELYGNAYRRVRIDLANADAIRLVFGVSTPGSTNALLFAQYSTDGNTWANLTSSVSISSNGMKTSAWEGIPSGARGDVWVRVAGQGGDGAADPVISQVSIQVK